MASEKNTEPTWESQGDLSVVTEDKARTETPRLYRILLHTDDYTAMDFVVMVLKTVFHHSEAEAVRIMLEVHQRGIGLAGIYSYEIAETRVHKVARLAREHEYPLRCSMEPE